jgi:hypothetical protein
VLFSLRETQNFGFTPRALTQMLGRAQAAIGPRPLDPQPVVAPRPLDLSPRDALFALGAGDDLVIPVDIEPGDVVPLPFGLPVRVGVHRPDQGDVVLLQTL